MIAVTGSNAVERPLFLPGPAGPLFGVLTRPAGDAPVPAGALILLSGAGMPAANHNRIWVRLAGRLAAEGRATLRLDWHGVGESAGRFEQVRLDRPPVDDLLAAVRWLGGHGYRRVVVAGNCLGARTVLAAAPHVAGLDAVALLDVPVAEPAAEVPARQRGADLIAGQLRALAARPVPCLLVQGEGDRNAADVAEFGLDDMVRAMPASRVHTVPGSLRGLPSLHVQQEVLDAVTTWVLETTAAWRPRGLRIHG